MTRARAALPAASALAPSLAWLPSRGVLAALAALTVLAATLTTAGVARAGEREALFEESARALEKGEYARAIEGFEALADRGFVHADASFDRGLAYAVRVREGGERPGDLGRAAAAFEESLLLRPGDPTVESALDLVRGEITKRRAKRAKSELDARPTLDRLLVALLPLRTWGLAALVASALLGLGLVLRKAKPGTLHVVGNVLAPVSALALVGLVPITLHAKSLAEGTRPAVVIAPEAALEDDDKKPLRSSERDKRPVAVPEGALVELHDRRDGRAKVRWGPHEGWVPITSVRTLAGRP